MARSWTTRRQVIGALCATAGAMTLPSRLFAAPTRPLLTFFVIGDWGRDGRQNQQAVANHMAEEARHRAPAFIISTGDNFYTFGVSGVNDRQWRSSFENIYHHDSIVGLPWYPVLGNHDYGGNVEAQIHYRGPHNRWHMGGRYYQPAVPEAAAAGVDLLFIDTVAWIGRESFPFYFLGDRPIPDLQREQAEWLTERLTASGARFKFVFGHHGIYSIGPHGGAMQLTELDAVLRSGGATYVHGHDHCLFHIKRSSMDYICSGAGSQMLGKYHGGLRSGCVFEGFCQPDSDAIFPRWNAFIQQSGFAVFEVYQDRVVFDLIGIGGEGEDSYRGYILQSQA